MSAKHVDAMMQAIDKAKTHTKATPLKDDPRQPQAQAPVQTEPVWWTGYAAIRVHEGRERLDKTSFRTDEAEATAAAEERDQRTYQALNAPSRLAYRPYVRIVKVEIKEVA